MRARKSRAASGTSPPTPWACCWWCWSPPHPCRTTPAGRRSSEPRAPCTRRTTGAGVDLAPLSLRAPRHGPPAESRAAPACAYFHPLPMADARCDVVVAAFCLYHSAAPGRVISEIARCLRRGGTAILVTKSADSYRELDHLVAASALDPCALSSRTLYQTAHSGNIPALVSAHLRVQRVIHHGHRFTFTNLAHAAEYLATSPKYQLPAQ